jgi:hypothetical protein
VERLVVAPLARHLLERPGLEGQSLLLELQEGEVVVV